MQVQHVMLGPQSCGQLAQASQPRLRCCCKEEQIPTHLAMQMSLLRWQLQQQVHSIERNIHIASKITTQCTNQSAEQVYASEWKRACCIRLKAKHMHKAIDSS